MQPAAAEVNRKSRIHFGQGAPTQPIARFDNQTIDAGIVQMTARGHARRAAADNRHFGIAFRHGRRSALAAFLLQQRSARNVR